MTKKGEKKHVTGWGVSCLFIFTVVAFALIFRVSLVAWVVDNYL